MIYDEDKDFPPVSEALIKRLEEVFPPQDFFPHKDYREMDFHFGQRSVVNFLKHHYERQTETIIHSPNHK